MKEEQSRKLVLHLSNGDSAALQGALRMLVHFAQQAENEKFASVLLVTGDAVAWFKSPSPAAPEIARTRQQSGCSIAICANALAAKLIGQSELMDGLTVVPAGVYELVRLQESGFAYVKA